VWPVCGLCVACVWPVCGLCVACVWPVCGLCVAACRSDIKPGNILIDKSQGGSAKICDFGLARLQEGLSDMTGLLGTPQYMAPYVTVDRHQAALSLQRSRVLSPCHSMAVWQVRF
jgi:hypothetical protein